MQVTKEKSHSDEMNKGIIKKISFADGSKVGIENLDNIIKEVAGLKLNDSEAIKKQLLDRVKKFNYMPAKAEDEYSTALFQEYRKKVDESVTSHVETHSHSGG